MTAAQAGITILVDNNAGSELAREHGLSLWIEADGNRVLFDTGQGAALPLNAGSLGIHTDRGLVVCVGCCHAGLINTLNFICRLTGVDTIAAVIGGFHMIRSGEEHIRWAISELLRLDPGTLVPCHCTGDAMVNALSHAFPDRVEKGCAGMHLTF